CAVLYHIYPVSKPDVIYALENRDIARVVTACLQLLGCQRTSDRGRATTSRERRGRRARGRRTNLFILPIGADVRRGFRGRIRPSSWGFVRRRGPSGPRPH